MIGRRKFLELFGGATIAVSASSGKATALPAPHHPVETSPEAGLFSTYPGGLVCLSFPTAQWQGNATWCGGIASYINYEDK